VRFLFVHQNFPGQYLHIVRHLAAAREHEIVFITQPNANRIPGVRLVPYRKPDPPSAATHWTVREFEFAARRAEVVARTAASLKQLGFTPDIIIGHHGWGELLNLQDVWPDTPLLGYHEFYYNLHGFDVGFDPEFSLDPGAQSRIRAKNALNLLALTNPGHGHTPTSFQHATYPAWARPGITVLREGVNLDACCPNPASRQAPQRIAGYTIAPSEKLVTYVVRDLEPYRGFHVFMRALPHILSARPDVRVILVGGDGVSYGARLAAGTWRQRMLDELAGRLDLGRVHFAGRVPYDTYVKLLQRSDAHVYLTYPFVASWSLREAMACGCALAASDTAPVQEFVAHRRTGLLVPFLQPEAIAEGVLQLLEDTALNARLRIGARAWAERHLRMDTYIGEYEALIASLTGAPATLRPRRRGRAQA
jgi:glycosyltransferase involved in cell wall biosynthesis